MPIPEARLIQNLTDVQRRGGFTHSYVACGLLSHENPSFEYFTGSPGVRFDLASLTKALYTTPLVLREFLEAGVLPQTILGEFAGGGLASLPPEISKLTLESLLGHRSGLPDWRAFWIRCLHPDWQELSGTEQLIRRIGLEAGRLKPEQGSLYSDVGFILLGMALEARLGRPGNLIFEDFCNRHLKLSRPLLSFNRENKEKNNSASCGYCPVRGVELRGVVHDENAMVFDGVCGHAGLFAEGRDLVSYLKELLASPLGEYLIRKQTEKRTGKREMTGLLGWQQGAGPSSFAFGQGSGIGHLGFTGTGFWVVPESGQYGVFLSNRVISGRVCDWITALRTDVFQCLYEILSR